MVILRRDQDRSRFCKLIHKIILFPLGLCDFLEDFQIVLQNGSNDRHDIGLNNTRADVFGATDTNINDTLESQVPLPHFHHVLLSALLENVDQLLNATINGENVSDSSGRSGEISKVV